MKAALARRLPLVVGAVGVLIVAVVAGLVLTSGSDGGDGPEGPDVTDPAKFDLPALDGPGRVRLTDFEGTPVVVNFFASWCEPCKEELPEFVEAARTLEGKVAFVAVNSKELKAGAGLGLARSMGLAEAGIKVARDVGPGGSGLRDAYREVRGNAMPITAFYDATGKLRYVAPGQLNRDRLNTRLQELYGVSL